VEVGTRNGMVMGKRLEGKWDIMRKGSREFGKSCETRRKKEEEEEENDTNTITQKQSLLTVNLRNT
jgi:hypothetical protein